MSGAKKTKRIRRFMGKIPKVSDTNFTFGGIALHHRAVKDETLLIHVDTKAIISAFPFGTERTVIVEAIARNHDKLIHFIEHPRSYDIYDTEETFGKVIKVAPDAAEGGITMDTYSDGSCVVPSQVTHDEPPVKKKSYNLTQQEEW